MSAKKLAEVSQDLAVAVDAVTGEPRRGYTAADIRELVVEGAQQFRASLIGQQLAARGGPGIWDEVEEHVALRLGDSNFGATPYLELLFEVGQDLLRTLRVPVVQAAPPPPPPAPKAPTAEELAAAEAVKEAADKNAKRLKHFAQLVTRQLNSKGVKSLMPKMGVVYLTHEDGTYIQEIPAAQFETMYQDAARLGYLTYGGVR